MITHIVFFKLHDPTPETSARTASVLRSMAGKIPQLRYLEVGVDFIRSNRSYDLALVTKFVTKEDLQAYQVHPYHAGEVVPYIKMVASSVASVDYES